MEHNMTVFFGRYTGMQFKKFMFKNYDVVPYHSNWTRQIVWVIHTVKNKIRRMHIIYPNVKSHDAQCIAHEIASKWAVQSTVTTPTCIVTS